jgi:Family of unknown function (DUF6516)
MPPAELIFHDKLRYADGAVLEMTLWQVPRSVRGSAHRFKYSLFYGEAGRRLVGYDNEAGKGDHRHYGDREERYRFTTPEQLLADFLSDLGRLRGGRR